MFICCKKQTKKHMHKPYSDRVPIPAVIRQRRAGCHFITGLTYGDTLTFTSACNLKSPTWWPLDHKKGPEYPGETLQTDGEPFHRGRPSGTWYLLTYINDYA